MSVLICMLACMLLACHRFLNFLRGLLLALDSFIRAPRFLLLFLVFVLVTVGFSVVRIVRGVGRLRALTLHLLPLNVAMLEIAYTALNEPQSTS